MPRPLIPDPHALPERTAEFVEPMECLAVPRLTEGSQWLYEVKLDGYRAIAVKSDRVMLYSRRKKSFNSQYPQVVEALRDLPPGTVVDGEVVALDDSGRTNFQLLQHSRSSVSRIYYYLFDLLIWRNQDVTCLPFLQRRALLNSLFDLGADRIRISDYIQAPANVMLDAVREQGLEGVIAKRKDSVYEPGKRSGAWIKYRVNRSQEFVIGGYIPGPHGIESIIVGYRKGKDLMYVARVRNGFVPASRRQVFGKIKHLATDTMPFANLPDEHEGRWGEGLTADKMEECVWLRPETVAQIEFLEWTDSDRLRHSKFVGLREDKDPRDVVKERDEQH